MHHQLLAYVIIIIVLHISPGSGEIEYFPGLRRPPNWAQSHADETTDLIAQIIEEQARRRFQQQLAQQHYYQFHHQHGPNAQNQNQNQNPAIPSFTYNFPEILGQSDNDVTPFAVNPSDPRYYSEIIPSSAHSNKLNTDEQNNIYHQQKMNSKINSNVPYSRIKPPMEVNPKMPSINSNLGGGNDLNTMSGNEDKTSVSVNDGQTQQRTDVTKKHMGMQGEMGMYVVALIAGVSAAVTVGLIALGIGWYTLQKKTKAAADVDYPAYGVTGPNKDISPSGDRRLAQSAQMYHYQHQKQQIIAMENRTAGEHAGGISDVESDDDNDEGDYTVYECPGLAPTGEMEVKNPLFLDDTPVTPSTQTVDGQPQQSLPQQKQQQQPNANQSQSEQPPKKVTKSSQSSSASSTSTSVQLKQQLDEDVKK